MKIKKYKITFEEAQKRFKEQGRTDIEICNEGYSNWKKKAKFFDLIIQEYFWCIPNDVFLHKTVHPKRRNQKKISTNLTKFGVAYPTQSNEIKEKTKQTNLEKYGVEYILQDKNIRTQIKQTNLEKYGVENPSQSTEIKEKFKQTCLEKYGVENPLQHEEIREKFKQTCLEKYGVENPSQFNAFKEKKIKTSLNNWGHEQPLSSKEVREKSKQTCLEKYGVEHPMHHSQTKEKIKKTLLEHYNVDHFSKSDSFMKEKKKTINENGEFIRDWLKNLEEPKPHISTINIIFKGKTKISLKELEEYIARYRSYKSNLEVFIEEHFKIKHYNKSINYALSYKPDFKLSDNVYLNTDGLYWHSEKQKDKHYHFNMRKEFEKYNLRLFQFREDEIYNKFEIIKSIVDNSLNQTPNKIYARNCYIKHTDSSIANDFLNQNHLMGQTKAKHLGLYETKTNKLIALMSYKCKNNICKIERFCSVINTNVIGGFSKLLNFLEKENSNITEIHNWIDLRYGTGAHLLNKNFIFIKETLGWKWTDGDNTFNRLKCRANMDNRLLTENLYAKELKWFKIFDAGQRLYVKKL